MGVFLDKVAAIACLSPPQLLKSRAQHQEWTVTADMLAELDSLADSRDMPALFVLIPDRYQVDLELFESHAQAFGINTEDVDLDQPDRRLMQELTARGLNVLDAMPSLRRTAESGRPMYGRVDSHLSPGGHRVLFDLIAPSIEAALWGSDPLSR